MAVDDDTIKALCELESAIDEFKKAAQNGGTVSMQVKADVLKTAGEATTAVAGNL